uniref:Uncharacterized protein n=1 Tax=uncultured marine virus TaxID=186617 RepID=A0A0F7L460_9VIRU|nr:hypothetical protein P12026_20 [uncultured marine virus]
MTLSVFQSSVVNNSGDVQGGAEIEVVNEANGLPANLYSTRAGAATTNPMFADADGFFRFYTEAGEYRITATSGPFSKTFRYVRVGDSGGKDASRVARGGDFMTYGGAANAITLTSVNTLPSSNIQAGDKFRFKATTTNTGTTTISVDGGPTITCKTPTGANLPAGFIRTDVITECEYDGVDFVVSRKVESGSNANGEWTRWEDGTQICKVSDQLQGGTSSFVISYPIEFYITSSNRRVASREIVNSIDFGNTIYDGTGDAALSVGSHGGTIIYETSNTISPFNDRVSVALSGLQSATSRYSDYSATATGKWY